MFPIGVFQNLFGSNEILPFRASLHSKSILHLSDELWDSWSKSHKKTKSQVYISVISTLCIHTRNPGNLTPFSFLIGADFAWGSLINYKLCAKESEVKVTVVLALGYRSFRVGFGQYCMSRQQNKQTQTEWVRISHTHNFKYLVVLKCAPFVPQF